MNQKRQLGIAATGSFCYALLSSVRALAERYVIWSYLLIASARIKLLFIFRIQCSFRKMKHKFISFSSVVQLTPLPYWLLSKLLAIYSVPQISRTESSVNACQSQYDHPLDFFSPFGFLMLPNLQWTPFNICFHRILLNPPSLSDWVFCLIFRNREIMMLLGISITRENDWWWELI